MSYTYTHIYLYTYITALLQLHRLQVRLFNPAGHAAVPSTLAASAASLPGGLFSWLPPYPFCTCG